MSGNVKKYRLDAFDARHLQVARNILSRLKKDGVASIDEAIEALAAESINRFPAQRKTLKRAVQKCRACGSPVVVQQCNTCKGTIVPGGYTRVFTCTNIKCLHQEYHK